MKHKADCNRVFKQYDATCSRCLELSQGAAARPGWGDFKRKNEAVQLAAIKAHDLAACERKNTVCTCFEW